MIIEDENGREWTTEELRDDYREPTEPDPEPPLDLDEVEELIAQRDAEFVDQQREAERRLLDEVLPRLLNEVDGHREAGEVWADLPTRTEWTVTASADEKPGDDALWQTSPEDAEQAHGRPGQLWCRTLTIGAPVAISSEAPF
ncbi:hypothetical protein [Nonomuraea angiospora]|uniref:hypothetical protein n=1 Tax=Nonomuraea angiospora TaxID=46172 RepID=UPI0029A28938|nr:hypothetical protein [Nonomuraea angiospora]MDX3111385.1 hypothetical protein [Nonomuraea angiospora]